MRVYPLSAALFLFAASSLAVAQAPGSTEKAVDDAIKVLEKAHAAAKSNDEKVRLEQVIEAIRDARRFDTNGAVIPLVDDPSKFKGKTVVLTGRFLSAPRQVQGIGDGPPMYRWQFQADHPEKKVSARVVLFVPTALKVPGVPTEGECVVSFLCREGRVDGGNVVKSIRRP
jgi:hypothetical protein